MASDRLGTRILIEEVNRLSKQANQRLYRLEKAGGVFTSKASAYNEWSTKVGRRYGLKTELYVPGDEKATIRNYTNELKNINAFLQMETSSVAGMKKHFKDLADNIGAGKNLTFKQAEAAVTQFFEMEKELKKMSRTNNLKYIVFGSKDSESWGIIREALNSGVKTPAQFRKYIKKNYTDTTIKGRARRKRRK